MRASARSVVCGLWLVAVCAPPAIAQTGANVLVVANAGNPASIEVAGYYAQKRQVPAEQVLTLPMPLTEEIPRTAFALQIEKPIADWLVGHSAQDRILYIVLTKGVPIRVAGSSGQQGTVASVDSELTLLYRHFAQNGVPLAGSITNPYFLGDAALTAAKPFSHRFVDMYLVTRLDGFTVADAKALVDRAASPTKDGRILLDERAELSRSIGNQWLERAAAGLRQHPEWKERVVFDSSPQMLHDQPNVLGYYSWGSNDPIAFRRHFGMGFVPGAIGAEFVSTDARTFAEPPDTWMPREKAFGGSPQSLIGDFIHDGITGVAGHVAEPYLNATIRPDILFPAYLSGMNLAEAFYLAMPFVSWQTIVVGDPLCAPFRQNPLSAAELDPGIDHGTELPVFLSARRVAAVTASGAKPEAVRLFVLGDVRMGRNDPVGARQALEEATKIDADFLAANLMLAGLYETAGQWDAAIDRYRRVLAKAPEHVPALNNLAYALAVHRNAKEEALPLAKRAFAASNRSAEVGDTLGWIQHLIGNDAEAEPLVVAAARGLPQSADVQLHAAVVLAANGKTAAAQQALNASIKLDSRLQQRADVRELLNRLAVGK